MADETITLDEDIEAMDNARYQALVKAFGEDEAKRIIAEDNDEELDDELKEVIEDGGYLE